MNKESINFGLLGRKYWTNFMRRNKDKISSQVGIQLASNRKDWCTYANFKRMYTLVYQQMLEAGIAVKLPEKTWMDQHGNIVEIEEEAFGLGCDFFETPRVSSFH